MEGNCQVNDEVYKCDVTRPLAKILYLGLAEAEWKSRFYNHKLSFKHKRYSNKTTLSSYMWYLKSVSSKTPNLKWSVWDAYHKYLEELSLVLIWKTGNSYLSKLEGTLQQEIWTFL